MTQKQLESFITIKLQQSMETKLMPRHEKATIFQSFFSEDVLGLLLGSNTDFTFKVWKKRFISVLELKAFRDAPFFITALLK